MPIQMQCPQCQTKAALPNGHAGRPVRCKVCKATFTIPPDAGANPDQPAVIDRYLVRELLGEGAFGSVYRAFDPRLERDVALKVLRPHMMSSAQAVERFLREAKSAAKLLHPNIVPVYDAGRSGSIYYIASAFIKGMTLASAIPEEGGIEPRRAVKLAAQLATALGYAHRQGILHRDVKPANAMLNEQESLHLMDFGLAGWTQEETTRLTRLGAVMGTPAYMAPEQASGDTKNVGPAADLYSAGVVLYELLTSRLPFDAGHPAAFAYLVVHTAPTPPSQHKPDLDAGLEAICLKAMAKKPEDRFASGEEMAAVLMQWTPMAKPLATPAPVVQPSKATIAPLASVSPKQTVLPSSGKLAARRPSVFDRETVMPVSAKRSTLGSPPPARTQGGARRQDAGVRRRLMLGGAVALAVAGALLVVTLIWFSSPKPPPNAEYADRGERQQKEPALVTQPDVGAKADSTTETPLVNPPPITVEPPETSGPPAVLPATVDPPVVSQPVSPPLVEPAVVPPPKPLPEPTLADEITNGIGMKLKLIKAGKFLMGSPKDEKSHQVSEGPQHEVEITKSFYLGVYPVTVGQFAAFVKDADYQTEAETDGRGSFGYNAATRKAEQSPKYTWRNPGFVQTDAHPVVNVSWNDSVKFCEWLSQKEKKTYGLPTEAQWEYSCRAGTTTAYSFGDDPQMLGDYSWYLNNSERQTHPVGGKIANRWGLYDMQGNVAQWCADYYDNKYYQNSPNKDPRNFVKTNARVFRGDSWSSSAGGCRAAYRYGRAPRFCGSELGLRVMMLPAEPLIGANPAKPPAADLVKVNPPVIPPPQEKLAKDITNDIGMKLKLIKPGKFLMGSPKDEKGHRDDESQHEVEITRPFYLGVYPVTVGQFAAFVKDTDYKTEAETNGRGGQGYNAARRNAEQSPKYTWQNPGFVQTDAHPVVIVSWNDAVKFCEWLSQKEKKTYTLPTEAQWEYACRAEMTTAYSFGDDSQMLGVYAWYIGNSKNHTHAVGGKKANRWGLYDMNGNVRQWCADYYDGKYYQNSPFKDPLNILKSGAGVLRGGCWCLPAEVCRAAHRTIDDSRDCNYINGFRVCFHPD